MHVVNLNTTGRSARITYVGRPSPLGNPFRIGPDGDRTAVIQRYKRWLWDRIQRQDPQVVGAMRALTADSILGCWCHPQPCHADVIVRAWHWMQKQQ
jgi:hypothetical protein